MGWFRSTAKKKPGQYKPALEALEDRTTPALVSSQFALTPPLLSTAEVDQLLQRASIATASNDAIIAIVDRGGNLLGVTVEAGVSPTITGNPDLLAFAIDGAISKARTAAFFANDQAPLTSRTIGFISQSTIEQREVDAYPFITDPDSTLRGPGYVAAVRTGAHFPPGVNFTPPVDLFGIEHTNRDNFIHPGADGIKGTADDAPYQMGADPLADGDPGAVGRFNIVPLAGDTIQELNPPASYGEIILSNAARLVPGTNIYQGRGIATLPGGIPIYEYGVLVGGIGTFFPGETGFATEENSSLSATFDATKPDRSLEAEFIGLAAVGGSSGAGLPVGDINGIAALPGFDIPFGRIDLVGVTLDVIGPGGNKGPKNLVSYAFNALGVGQGVALGSNMPVDNLGNLLNAGVRVPEGWIVQPRDGVGISAAEVRQIIEQGVAEANIVRAQIRLPNDERTRMVLAVSDTAGNIVGLFRMPDATVFSIDVAVAKSRNTAYYNNPALLQPVDQTPGVPPGAALTNRTFRFLAQPRFPSGIDGQFAPFSILNDGGSDPFNATQVGPRLPASAFNSVYGYDSFHPGTNFRNPLNPFNQNGIVFFPGSSSVHRYAGGAPTLIGGFGVSGDGVDEDDVVTNFGIASFAAPFEIRSDQFFTLDVRLPYMKFNRNPEN